MFKNILVPTDLTEKGAKALDIALGLGSKGGFTVTLLHVIEVIEDTDEDFKGFYDKLERRARARMADTLEQYPNEKERIRTEILFGNRAGEIVKYAHDQGVDLIVLSSHRIDPKDASSGWATISYRVGILSHCPVMMVK